MSRVDARDVAGLVRHTVERALERCRGVTVARVTRFTAGSVAHHPTCSAQPLTPRFVDDGPAVFDDVLDDVPVAFLGSRACRHDHALADGDLVLLLVLDRSGDLVDDLLQTPGIQDPQPEDPQSPRMHDIADCFALPIATFTGRPSPPDFAHYPAPPVPAVPRDAFTVDLLHVVVQILQELQTAQVATMLGPQTFLPAALARFAELEARLAAVE